MKIFRLFIEIIIQVIVAEEHAIDLADRTNSYWWNDRLYFNSDLHMDRKFYTLYCATMDYFLLSSLSDRCYKILSGIF